MKKLFLLCSILTIGFVSASECNTQTTQDSDGDTVSVTCCRTTYQEAFDCAQAKLKKAVEKTITYLEP
jgi:hypothetical protein